MRWIAATSAKGAPSRPFWRLLASRGVIMFPVSLSRPRPRNFAVDAPARADPVVPEIEPSGENYCAAVTTTSPAASVFAFKDKRRQSSKALIRYVDMLAHLSSPV
jgi:hypothetical protein